MAVLIRRSLPKASTHSTLVTEAQAPLLLMTTFTKMSLANRTNTVGLIVYWELFVQILLMRRKHSLAQNVPRTGRWYGISELNFVVQLAYDLIER